MCWSWSSGRVEPDQDTGLPFKISAKRSSFSSKSSSYLFRSNPKRGKDSVKEPRPKITSARPSERASNVEKR
ncbi:hypothetical protein D3C87_1956330 [compost metagenome]